MARTARSRPEALRIGPRLGRALLVAMMAIGVAAGGAGASACYVEEGPPPVYGGYDPQYYDGYVVYYDAVGRPYYYVNGAVFWVPPGSPFYVGLVDHWRFHRAEYYRWYGAHGYRYRAYRRR